MHALLRDAASRVGRPVAIMQDLSGPKIRIGRLRDGTAVTLKTGAQFRIVTARFGRSRVKILGPVQRLRW